MVDRTGQQLGNYLLTRPLGQGGFAEVYLGQHIYLKTQAAIKVLLTQLSGDDMEEFLNEARTIANLIHPNIVRVLDFGVQNTTPFLVMDYAPNGTLRQRHPKGSRLEPAVIGPYIKQIAAALQYAHDQKLIHRDIKPENLLVGRHNEILLSDFGIALVAQSSRYQSTKDVVGTVAYMSPEQIQGKPRPASDQYSLGIVFYEWLSGNRPFHGSFTELCAQHIYALPPPLRERVPSLSLEVEQVVNTALAKDPRQRFGSVQAFANAFELAGQNQEHIATFVKPQQVPKLVQPTPSIKPMTPVSQPAPSFYQPVTPPPSPKRVSSPAPRQASQQPAAQIPANKVKIWSIDRRRIRAIFIGTAIGSLLIALAIMLQYGISVLGINPAFDIVLLVFLSIALVSPQFFGSVFGPWAGLITASVGPLLGIMFVNILLLIFNGRILNTFSLFDFYSSLWRFALGLALSGFISGFATFKFKGRYNIRRSLGFSILGNVTGGFLEGALVVPFILHLNYLGYYLLSWLVTVAIYLGINLLLLPILLISYYKILARSKQKTIASTR